MGIVEKSKAERKEKADATYQRDLQAARANATLAYSLRYLADTAYKLRCEGIEVLLTLSSTSTTSRWVLLKVDNQSASVSWESGKDYLTITASHSDQKYDPVPLPDNGHIQGEARRIADLLSALFE